jgi:DNA helicase-2/ATP-dependent DNA helicase PcrA
VEVKSVRDYYKEICKNERQRQAVESCKNTVVIAGPGSGKTRIISMKAALLRSQDIGVACISFGNPTEMRIRDQLLEMGIREDDHLFVGTVHGFCLKYIVYPFINLIENDWPTNFSIASEFHVNDALNYTVSKLRTKQLRPSDISRIQKQLILGIIC